MKKIGHAIYSPAKGTEMLKEIFYQSWYRLEAIIKREYLSDPHPGLRIAVVEFTEPYLTCKDTTLIALAVMKLLIKYVYNIGFKYGKFTIGYTMITPRGDPITFSIGKAIELIDESGNAVPNMDVYLKIEKNVIQKAEEYDKNLLKSIYVRVYMLDRLEISDKDLPSSDEIASIIWNLIKDCIGRGEPLHVNPLTMGKIRTDPQFITALKSNRLSGSPLQPGGDALSRAIRRHTANPGGGLPRPGGLTRKPRDPSRQGEATLVFFGSYQP